MFFISLAKLGGPDKKAEIRPGSVNLKQSVANGLNFAIIRTIGNTLGSSPIADRIYKWGT
jgi:hypothetical protein